MLASVSKAHFREIIAEDKNTFWPVEDIILCNIRNIFVPFWNVASTAQDKYKAIVT